MTKQHLSMYRRIWFPLVVYYKLAVVQIRIYRQQPMGEKEAFWGKSSSTPSHKLHKVPNPLSTFYSKITSTKNLGSGIFSSKEFCCFQASFVSSTSTKVSNLLILAPHQLLPSHHRLIADVRCLEINESCSMLLCCFISTSMR